MTDLAHGQCRPRKGEAERLDREDARRLLGQVAGWTLEPAGTTIERNYQFRSYYETIAFVNALMDE